MTDGDFGIDPISIDVSRIIGRTVASLYSNLVTRPTGRAVRMAIESQLGEVSGIAVSTIDFSEVQVIDFSCADEVVAKLLLRFQADDRPIEVFFVFRGIGEPHRDPIQSVLERHDLLAVAESPSGGCELLGVWSESEGDVWRLVEGRGGIASGEIDELLPSEASRSTLERLARRRVIFRREDSGDYHALSTLAHGSR